MPDEQRLEEQLLSQGAGKMISEQLDKLGKVDVDVQTDLFKMIQGQVDGVSLSGEGLELQDIRVQEITLQTDNIAVNPLSALFGQIELSQPVNATVRIVLTEEDINRALSSDSILSQMPTYELNVDGEIVSLKPQEIQIQLPSDRQMGFTGKVLLKEKGDTRTVGFTAMVRPRTSTEPIILESFNCTQGEGICLDTVAALIKKVKELVNLPSFEYQKTALSIKSLVVQKGILKVLAQAHVKQIPS
ncbi:MAG: DUF2993 domain-containing protein [Rhizonema sp. NSF051]|nr:DUF2993 domain-containing protein [Rhizonema sp. NSF051]